MRFKRALKYLLLAGSGTVLFVDGTNAGFARCAGDMVLTAVNACFVFDCTNGALGGTIEFCGPEAADNIFLDCP